MLLVRMRTCGIGALGWVLACMAMAEPLPKNFELSPPNHEQLMAACTRGDHAQVLDFLQRGAAPDSQRVPSLDSPLNTALCHRREAVACLLIDFGASVQQPLADGQPALHLAIARNCQRTVKHLLSRGANPNQAFNQPAERSYLRWVEDPTLRWVLINDKPVTPIMLAASQRNTEITRMLMKAGAKTEIRTKKAGLWPINFASRRADIAMMRVMMGLEPDGVEREITITLSTQKLRMVNSKGEEIFTTKVSTGKKGFDTKPGQFVVTDKFRTWKSTLYPAQMPYFLRLSCADFGMHQGVVPGYPASHGCIRVPAGNATKLFEIARRGDVVHIVP